VPFTKLKKFRKILEDFGPLFHATCLKFKINLMLYPGKIPKTLDDTS